MARIVSLPVVALVALSFALGCSEFVIVGILPEMASSLSVDITLVGNLVGVFAGVYAVSTPVLSLALAQFSRYRALMLLCLVFVAGNVATALAGSYEVLFAARVVTACTSGTATTLAMTFVADIAEPKARPKVIAVVFAGFSVASVLGVPLGTAISQLAGWHAAFWTISALAALVAVVLAATLPRRASKSAESRITLRGQLSVLKDRRTQLNAAQILLSMGGVYVYYTYLSPLLVGAVGVPEAALPLALSAYGFVAVLSNLSAGLVADRWGQRAVPAIYASLAVLLAVLPLAVAAAPALGFAVCLLIGYATSLHNSTVQVLFMEVAEADYPQALNFASSLNPTAYNVGIAFGSFVGGGVVAATGGVAWLGPVGALLAAAACASALRLAGIVSGKQEA